MSDLRGALAISNDVHAELMEAVRDGREPARVAAAAAARRANVTLTLNVTLVPTLTLRNSTKSTPDCRMLYRVGHSPQHAVPGCKT